jgi:hypothetical protein
MEELAYLDVIKRLVRDREKQISETLMSGALESIEHYKFLQGELNALYYIEDGLKELNKEK